MIYETKNYKVVYDFLNHQSSENLSKVFYYYEIYCKLTKEKLKEGSIAVNKLDNAFFSGNINQDVYVKKNLIDKNNNFSLFTDPKLKSIVACCVYKAKGNYIIHGLKNGISCYKYDKKNNVYVFTKDRETYEIIKPNGTVATVTVNDEEPFIYLFGSENILYQLISIENKIATIINLNTNEVLKLSYKGIKPNLKKLGNRKVLINSFDDFYFNSKVSLFRINFKELKMERMRTNEIEDIEISNFNSPHQLGSLLRKKDCYDFIKLICCTKVDKDYCIKFIYKDKIVSSLDKVGMSLPFFTVKGKIHYFDTPVELNISQLGLDNIKLTELRRSGNFQLINFLYDGNSKIHTEVFDLTTMTSLGLDLEIKKDMKKQSSIETKKKIIKIKLN